MFSFSSWGVCAILLYFTGSTLGKDAEDVRTGAVLHSRSIHSNNNNGSGFNNGASSYSAHHRIPTNETILQTNRTDEEENRGLLSRQRTVGVAVALPLVEEIKNNIECII